MLLDADRYVWKTYSDKATENAQKVTDAYAKLIEEQKRKLEEFVRESQRMLLEIPEFD